MTPENFKSTKWGRVLKQPEGFYAFVPSPLPPQLDANWKLAEQLGLAERELARLSGLAINLPNPKILISPFVRREAVLSSRIEGTQASLSDLFFFEAADHPSPNSDVEEVANYVRALEYGLKRINSFPISLRLINELHAKLMDATRGGHLTPGEFRRSQNWIGPPGCTLNDATYVPPPVHEMKAALGAFEKYIHSAPTYPTLIRLAFIHYQFEAIHPFLDGNGRIGRLLITLLLCTEKVLQLPMLYLSAFFEKNRPEYYRKLLAVSQEGQWSEWVEFFLRGVAEQSKDATQRIEKLLALKESYAKRFHGRRASTLPLRLIDAIFQQPVISISRAAEILKVTPRAASLNVDKLVKQKILVETTGRERNRLFAAREVIAITEAALTPSDRKGS